MNRLPKYWVVKNPTQIVKDYLAKTYNVPDVLRWNHDFIGFDGTKAYNGVHGTTCLEYLVNDPAILTLDEFIELSKPIDEFVLPEKWCVKCTKENYSVLDKWFFEKTSKHRLDANKCSYWHYPENSDGNSTSSEIWDGYKEITFEQFKKYVLKSKDMEKEIIGYKLKNIKYRESAEKILQTGFYKEDERIDIRLPDSIELFRKLDLLDLWFEPVYKAEYQVGDWVSFYSPLLNKTFTSKIKEWGSSSYCYLENGEQPFKHLLKKATPEEIKAAQYPQIEINGYKGEFFNDYVKFGCAEIHKNVFMDLNTLNSDLENGDGIIGMKSNRRIESVTIGKGTFNKEQIKQIAGYYLNKK